ncbi:ANTAR domain-containing protein [Rhodococcus sp. WS3]|uniref:GAF and ANTAR domain-containing protein n=1 Tax=Rhodococcus sp. WS3 TaxID=2486271 RepID=UPI001143D6AF|nr:GAF and ANTAR domain-containing protein [Rhodococcus sp. WS3]ROZ49716.1 ANTAR domain-containing protein [Rhodococcus sp. WS3]
MKERSEDNVLDRALGEDIDPGELIEKLDALVTALSDVAARVGPGNATDALLQQVCVRTVETISGADMAGVTLLSESGVPRTAASTNKAVLDVDFEQYISGEGPCLEAARTRSVVRATVADSELRWPTFTANLRGAGVQSFLSAPIWIYDRHAGALNIYSRGAHGFSEVDALILRVYTTSIEGLLRVSREIEFAKHEIAGLNTAMKSRATIEQAKGILMAIHGFGSERAFDVLVKESQRKQQKLHVIAEEIVERAKATG